MLRRILDRLPVDRELPRRVLDVGGGYGVLTREILESLPLSSVVLVDISQRMLDHARDRLGDYGVRVRFVQADLRDSAWVTAVDGPFDAVASSMAIHNVRDVGAIQTIYTEMVSLLRPGGIFLNIDLVPPAEANTSFEVFDLLAQMNYLRDLGLEAINCVHKEGPLTAIVASTHPIAGPV
jgi:ubiquinone/menaquinone biosynthesis C-methylase UbiE